MASAAEKRAWLCNWALNFNRGKTNYIYESGGDNRGPLLTKWLKSENASPHRDGNPWCASFVSSTSYWTDKHFNYSQPKRSYFSASSQHTGAGLFSKNYKEAVPGVAVSWSNGDGTGHVGLVLAVSSTGITTAEGNTSEKNPQNRNGGVSAIKTLTWAEVKSPHKGRYFKGYYKIWPEDTESLKKGLPKLSQAEFDAAGKETFGLRNYYDSGLSQQQNKSTKIRASAGSYQNSSNLGAFEIQGSLSSIKGSDTAKTSGGMLPVDKLVYPFEKGKG